MSWLSLSALLAALSNITIGVFVLSRSQRHPRNVFFACMTFGLAIWATVDFIVPGSALTDEQALIIDRFSYFGANFVPSTFLGFALWLVGRSSRELIRVCLGVSSLLALLSFTPLIVEEVHRQPFREDPGFAYPAFGVFFAGCLIYGLWVIWRALHTSSPYHRNQLRYVMAATAFGLVALIVFALVTYRWHVLPVHYVIEVGVVLTLAYAIARHRLMDVNVALTRAAVFAFCYAPLLLVPVIGGIFLEHNLTAWFGARWWIIPTALEIIFTGGGLLIYRFLQNKVEARVLAEQRRYQAALRQASQGMTLIKDLDRLLQLIVHLLTQQVRLRHAAIYLGDKQTGHFVLKVARQWARRGQAPVLAPTDPLVAYLRRHRGALVTEELALRAHSETRTPSPVVQCLHALEAAVVIPSFVEEHCLGFLILGEKKSGALYSLDDLQVFQVLANQAALAIENAQFYEELKQTQADLFQTAKMASLGQMAGGMSHQINNRFYVLTILAGTMKAALKDRDPTMLEPAMLKALWQKTIETMTKIEDNSMRGGDIVKTLLRFSKPSKEAQPITVQEIVALARDTVQYRVNLDAVEIRQTLPEGLSPIQGNLNQLADCCFNLIGNAYDATQKKAELLSAHQLPPGPRDPTPYKGQIAIAARVEQTNHHPWVVLEIQDNGIGMTPQEQTQLFIPFFTTKATAEKGTGLGLFIIKRILEQHGGTITAASTYGVGTTFTMRLPPVEANHG